MAAWASLGAPGPASIRVTLLLGAMGAVDGATGAGFVSQPAARIAAVSKIRAL